MLETTMFARVILCTTFAAALLTTPAFAASKRDWDECKTNNDRTRDHRSRDRNIAACTRIIDGRETQRRRASSKRN